MSKEVLRANFLYKLRGKCSGMVRVSFILCLCLCIYYGNLQGCSGLSGGVRLGCSVSSSILLVAIRSSQPGSVLATCAKPGTERTRYVPASRDFKHSEAHEDTNRQFCTGGSKHQLRCCERT